MWHLQACPTFARCQARRRRSCPVPLPNIGKSEDSPDGYTTTVIFEGKKVAIKGATYKSTTSPDMASKGTGGGIVSSVEEGKTGFAAPGSMNVKAEGKNIQLLGDAMMNNGSNPWNAATAPGNIQLTETQASYCSTSFVMSFLQGSGEQQKKCEAEEKKGQRVDSPSAWRTACGGKATSAGNVQFRRRKLGRAGGDDSRTSPSWWAGRS